MPGPELDEPARLARLRARATEGAGDPTGGAFDLFFRGDHEASFAAFERAKGSFWGHERFQSTRPFAGAAIAAARAGHDGLAAERFRAMGQLIEGGSIRGHALALLALLGRYDRLEHHPALPQCMSSLTPALRARLEARNALLRPAARPDATVGLVLLAGDDVGTDQYTHPQLADALAAEAALRCGDLNHADLRFRALASWRSDWQSQLAGDQDPRTDGLLGRARVARRRKKMAVALAHCEACLALAPTHAGALLLAIALSARRSPARAAEYAARLRDACPLQDVRVDGLSRGEIEQTLGLHDRRRDAYERAVAAGRARRYAEAARLFDRALDGLATAPRGAERDAAAALLHALAMAEQLEAMHARATKLLRLDASFVSAREALAYATGRTGDVIEAARLFDGAGTGRLFDVPIDLGTWLALPVARALSPVPTSAEERAQLLLMRGSTDAGLRVLAEVDLAPNSELRWLAAGSLWKDRDPTSPAGVGERAWSLLEPLLDPEPVAPHVATLASELAAATGRAAIAIDEPPPEVQRARSLADEAWAHERRGRLDAAIASYLCAAEAHPPLGALGLGNAGNLLTARGERDRALDFLTTALTHSSQLAAPARALVLSQTAHHFRSGAMHSDALPCETLAFELAPTAARAAHIAIDRRVLGDRDGSAHFRELAARMEPRQPELHALAPGAR